MIGVRYIVIISCAIFMIDLMLEACATEFCILYSAFLTLYLIFCDKYSVFHALCILHFVFRN